MTAKAFMWFMLAAVVLGLAAQCASPDRGGVRSARQPASGLDGNAGYSQRDADWLRARGVSPYEARAVEEVCGAACR